MDQEIASQINNPSFDIEQFKQLYKTFERSSLAQLPTLYSPFIVFKDPIHELKGIAALGDYFAGFCKPETKCQFEFTNQVIAHDQAFFQWKMSYQHPSLGAGLPLTLNGGTLIKFNSKIVYHEDFYDMGAMVYQHLPVIGWAVKKINARITG
ncbi:MAG: nuclear transport factor 2 family protein [Moraxellaceae bacterium]|nr:MAG: nuclear transport factor 2 family protein [Moraxellaceae bacterium]